MARDERRARVVALAGPCMHPDPRFIEQDGGGFYTADASVPLRMRGVVRLLGERLFGPAVPDTGERDGRLTGVAVDEQVSSAWERVAAGRTTLLRAAHDEMKCSKKARTRARDVLLQLHARAITPIAAQVVVVDTDAKVATAIDLLGTRVIGGHRRMVIIEVKSLSTVGCTTHTQMMRGSLRHLDNSAVTRARVQLWITRELLARTYSDRAACLGADTLLVVAHAEGTFFWDCLDAPSSMYKEVIRDLSYRRVGKARAPSSARRWARRGGRSRRGSRGRDHTRGVGRGRGRGRG